ncbi:GNAT family N-acetyltransferase [Dactylosporangium sp. NPDC051541]|uniref:GNAT family N-acetyltransferase n=1 Tax=Dactylosporangium sp. NPDC051541 TaxID=3363977 RepID=UPI0037B989F8
MPALPYPDPPLADALVLLRPWRDEDAGQRYAAFTDAETLRYSWPLLDPPTPAAVTASAAQNETDRLAGLSINFAAVSPADPDHVLGAASVYDVNPAAGRAAVGYWVAPWARRRGVATHSVRLLAAWAFGPLGVERLELTCGPDNTPSAAVAARCGFVREGVLRSHLPFKGARRDTLLFSLLPGELR